jgi:hypothetical protein
MINRMIIAERPFDIIQGRFVSVAHFISHKKVAKELAAALNASFEGVHYEAVEENRTGNWVVALRRGETIKKVHTAFCTGWVHGRGGIWYGQSP